MNQFAQTGEAFYTARVERRLVGVCGLNRDPYAAGTATGHIRRLYVLPEYRRKGVGKALVRRAMEQGRQYFERFHVRTVNPQADAFFLALGFTRVIDQGSFTHQFTVSAEIQDRNMKILLPVMT